MAIVFEDPLSTTMSKDDAALRRLARIFDQHFVISRNAGNDGVLMCR